APEMPGVAGSPPGQACGGGADFLARLPLHPEDRPKWEAAAAAHFAGTTTRLDREIRILRHGETRWLHLTGLISRDATGEPTRWTGSVADVTDRRAAEDALRLSEHRYALAMEATGDGHWDWDIRADKMYVSALLLEMCGLPPDMTFANRAEWVSRFRFFPGGEFAVRASGGTAFRREDNAARRGNPHRAARRNALGSHDRTLLPRCFRYANPLGRLRD